jgi:hypothetical protein
MLHQILSKKSTAAFHPLTAIFYENGKFQSFLLLEGLDPLHALGVDIIRKHIVNSVEMKH